MNDSKTQVSKTPVSKTPVSQTAVSQTEVDQTDIDETEDSQTLVFKSPSEALQQSKERSKGPKKVFEVVFQNRVFWVLALNRFRALGSVAAFLGGVSKKYEEPKLSQLEASLKGLSESQLKELLAKITK